MLPYNILTQQYEEYVIIKKYCERKLIQDIFKYAGGVFFLQSTSILHKNVYGTILLVHLRKVTKGKQFLELCLNPPAGEGSRIITCILNGVLCLLLIENIIINAACIGFQSRFQMIGLIVDYISIWPYEQNEATKKNQDVDIQNGKSRLNL